MATNIQISVGGNIIDQIQDELILISCQPYLRDGNPVLVFVKPTRTLVANPDQWDAKEVKLWINDVLIFTGDTSRHLIHYDDTFGWVKEWTCTGLSNRATWVPVTDQVSLTDTAHFNMAPDDPHDIPSRDGRTIGQIAFEVLSMKQISTQLQSYGIGNYSSFGQGAQVICTIANGRILNIIVVYGGSGYTVPPIIRFSGGGGSGAIATAATDGNAVTGVTMNSTGSGYTSAPVVIISTLPAQTVADLDALIIIPPYQVDICGEHVLQTLEGVVQAAHPNQFCQVQADGTIRFVDPRTFPASINVVLNKNSDANARWGMPTITTDWSQCYTNTVVRGSSYVVPVTVQTQKWPGSPAGSDGGLVEFFDHDGLTNNQAKAAWNPVDFTTPMQSQGTATAHATVSGNKISTIVVDMPGYNYQSVPTVQISDLTGTGAAATAVLGTGDKAGTVISVTVTNGGSSYSDSPIVLLTGPAVGQSDIGTCTMPSTTQVICTSSNASTNWPADYWDQVSGNHYGTIVLRSEIISGYQQYFTSKIVANTPLSAGGTSTVTLQTPAPDVSYKSYQIYGTAGGASYVWRRYKVTNPQIAAQMTNYFAWPVAYRNSDGTSATLVSTAQAIVMHSSDGNPPYQQSAIGVNVDPVSGTILLSRPSALVFSPDQKTVIVPSNVQAFLPVNNGELSTVYPPNDSSGNPVYAGSAFTKLGIRRTKYISVSGWTDYSQGGNMNLYAQEFHSVMSNIVYEGTITHHGLIDATLVVGQGLTITGVDYQTGLEGVILPIVACSLTFNQRTQGGSSFETELTFSTRRTPFSGAVFQRPAMTGMPFGFEHGIGGMETSFGIQQWTAGIEVSGKAITSEVGMRSAMKESGVMGIHEGAFGKTMETVGGRLSGEAHEQAVNAMASVFKENPLISKAIQAVSDMQGQQEGEDMETGGMFSRVHGGVQKRRGSIEERVERVQTARHNKEKAHADKIEAKRKAHAGKIKSDRKAHQDRVDLLRDRLSTQPKAVALPRRVDPEEAADIKFRGSTTGGFEGRARGNRRPAYEGGMVSLPSPSEINAASIRREVAPTGKNASSFVQAETEREKHQRIIRQQAPHGLSSEQMEQHISDVNRREGR